MTDSQKEQCPTQELASLQSKLKSVLIDGCLEATRLPLCPEIELYLLNDSFPQENLTAEQVDFIMHNPLYWVFCWASGQVLARWVLDNPSVVAGKRVLDLGPGCGVVAIAAAMAGAKEVIACDIDQDACAITAINAKLNQVSVKTCGELDALGGVDVSLVADVLYDRSNYPLLSRLQEKSAQVVVADSRVKNFDFQGFEGVFSLQSSTWPDLDESQEFRQVNVYCSGFPEE